MIRNERGVIMSDQFENPEVEKLDDETIEKVTPKKDMDRVADKLAEKAANSEKQSEKDESNFPI